MTSVDADTFSCRADQSRQRATDSSKTSPNAEKETGENQKLDHVKLLQTLHLDPSQITSKGMDISDISGSQDEEDGYYCRAIWSKATSSVSSGRHDTSSQKPATYQPWWGRRSSQLSPARANGALRLGRGGAGRRRCGRPPPRAQARRPCCTDETPSRVAAVWSTAVAAGRHIAPPCCGGDGIRGQLCNHKRMR